jgi:hypothetical protein
MNDEHVSITLSRETAWTMHSAANEATIYDDEEREQGGAPSEADSDLLSDSIDEALEPGRPGPCTWTVPVSLLPAVRSLIPACLAVHDEEELQIRTMRGAKDLEAAQAELLALLEPYDA